MAELSCREDTDRILELLAEGCPPAPHSTTPLSPRYVKQIFDTFENGLNSLIAVVGDDLRHNRAAANEDPGVSAAAVLRRCQDAYEVAQLVCWPLNGCAPTPEIRTVDDEFKYLLRLREAYSEFAVNYWPPTMHTPMRTTECRVILRGRGHSPIVCGTTKEPLTPAQYDIVAALLAAGAEGLSKDALDNASGHTEARKTLGLLAKSDSDWGEVIHMAGKPGVGYRIR